MKKAGCYLALFLLLNSNMMLYQLGKLPVLVQHFQEHVQRDRTVGLLDFLSMHYWGKDINDNDQERDRQLPFKDMHKQEVEPNCTVLIKPFVLKPVVHFSKSSFPLRSEPFLPDPGLSSLFRPPKA